MPVKIARSAARPSFGLPELLVAIHTSRQSCSKAGKARIFALVWESSGESRFNNESDAKALANWLVSKSIDKIEIDELAAHFPEWTQRRMNSALNHLHDAKLIDLTIVLNQGPWVMKQLRVTDHTRRFVRDHG